jgi:hypothetical protein
MWCVFTVVRKKLEACGVFTVVKRKFEPCGVFHGCEEEI